MSRIKSKKLTVNADPAADSWDWYQRDAAADVDVWLASIDSGAVAPFGKSVEPEIRASGSGDVVARDRDPARRGDVRLRGRPGRPGRQHERPGNLPRLGLGIFRSQPSPGGDRRAARRRVTYAALAVALVAIVFLIFQR